MIDIDGLPMVDKAGKQLFTIIGIIALIIRLTIVTCFDHHIAYHKRACIANLLLKLHHMNVVNV